MSHFKPEVGDVWGYHNDLMIILGVIFDFTIECLVGKNMQDFWKFEGYEVKHVAED